MTIVAPLRTSPFGPTTAPEIRRLLSDCAATAIPTAFEKIKTSARSVCLKLPIFLCVSQRVSPPKNDSSRYTWRWRRLDGLLAQKSEDVQSQNCPTGCDAEWGDRLVVRRFHSPPFSR